MYYAPKVKMYNATAFLISFTGCVCVCVCVKVRGKVPNLQTRDRNISQPDHRMQGHDSQGPF
jgi:hypothetical protein